MPHGDRIYKINANNGKKIKEFGKNGSIEAFPLVAPMIYKNNLVVVGMSGMVSMFDINNRPFSMLIFIPGLPLRECFHGILIGFTVATLLTVETGPAEGHRGNIRQNVSTVSNVSTVHFAGRMFPR